MAWEQGHEGDRCRCAVDDHVAGMACDQVACTLPPPSLLIHPSTRDRGNCVGLAVLNRCHCCVCVPLQLDHFQSLKAAHGTV